MMDRRKFMTAAPATALPALATLGPAADRSEAMAVFRALSPDDQALVLAVALRLSDGPALNLYADSAAIEANPDPQA
jgi:hypothetical protein